MSFMPEYVQTRWNFEFRVAVLSANKNQNKRKKNEWKANEYVEISNYFMYVMYVHRTYISIFYFIA